MDASHNVQRQASNNDHTHLHPAKKKKPNKFAYAFHIGLSAGLIWGGLKLAYFGLKFTKVVPGFLLEPFYKHYYLATWPGLLIGWASFIGLSILAALLYMPMVHQLNGPWPGVLYGFIWWVLLYLVIGPLAELLPGIGQLDMNSLITDLSLFLLWGLFIGYSCGFEYNDEQDRAPGVEPA